VDNLRTLKADLFPLDDDVTTRKLNNWLTLMTKRTRWTRVEQDPPLCRYEVDGISYLHAVYWREHQRVSHPGKPAAPPCPFHDDAGARRERLANDSGSPPEEPPEAGRNGSGGVPESFRPSRTPAEQGAGSREQGSVASSRQQRAPAPERTHAGERANGADPTVTGNRLLADHAAASKAPLPRDLRQQLGKRIDALLGDGFDEQLIAQGLAQLRTRPNLGPGVLPSLVNELAQRAAGPSDVVETTGGWDV
jgi:hypothetical protein